MAIARALGCMVILLLAASKVSAQQWVLKVLEPPLDSCRVTKDVSFATSDGAPLRMDVYRPSQSEGALPAVIFYTLYWPAEGPSARTSGDWFKSWARLAAANGLVAIIPDLRAEPGTGTAERPARAWGDDFQRLVAHVTGHAGEYGVDAERIGVFAESGSTWPALAAVEDPAQTAIKAAVVYYGSANIETFRRDLPLLWVRAGLDSQRTNADIARLSALALSQNAPVTILNHPAGRHGFEGRDESAVTRDVIEQTLAFFKRATTADFQAAIRRGPEGRTR
jgi:dienelactone hydrolase